MGRNLGIALLVLIILGLLYWGYTLLFSPSKTGGVNTNPSNGDITIVPHIVTPTNYIRVSKNQVVPVGDPNNVFTNVNDVTTSSFNLLSNAGTNPNAISVVYSFNENCPQFVWHNKWLYSFVKTEAAAARYNAGDKICYYEVKKSDLPNTIKMRVTIPPYNAPAYRYFLSGTEYRWKENIAEAISLGQARHYSIYQKV